MVSVLEENSREYYFQDELGSPIRLADVDGRLMETFGYDEFGQSLYGHEEVHDFGVVQPFGYTGYQHDRVSGTYFAQAREYLPEMGRFGAKDWIKGTILWPMTMNAYGYCKGNPQTFVDLDGREVYYFYDPNTFRGKNKVNMFREINSDIEELENLYGTKVIPCRMDSDMAFEMCWNAMDDSNGPIDAVVIYSHASQNLIVTNSHYEINWKQRVVEYKQDQELEREMIKNLPNKDIDTLILIGCNTGYTKQDLGKASVGDENVATVFAQREGIRRVIAADGNIWRI